MNQKQILSFYLSGIEGEDLSFMSFSYYPQDTQKTAII